MTRNVWVGLSGGVDSAVSTALLKERGYEVTGVFIKIWQPEFIECTWKEDRLDAMRVCVALDIPFREVDLSAEYKKEVIDHMVQDYARGSTPNPDVLCNRHIKFGSFSNWAFAEGADMVATGHYARIRETADGRELLRGVDSSKDQSYFLWQLNQKDLSRALFPVGEYPKSRVRELAQHFRLPVATKADSQGLCFVGQVGMEDFLGRFIENRPGAVVNTAGKRIGTHGGVALYTVGQRHGFEIAERSAHAGPLFVVDIDVASNTLTVSARRMDAARAEVELSEVRWVGKMPELSEPFDAQARYHEQPVSVHVSPTSTGLRARFATPHLASPGQSLVLYRGEVLLGGGTIV